MADYASLTVAIVAIGIAAASTWYARSSAHASRRSAVASEKSAGAAEKAAQAQVDLVKLEKQRRLDEYVKKGIEMYDKTGSPPVRYLYNLPVEFEVKEQMWIQVACMSERRKGQPFDISFRKACEQEGLEVPP